MLTPIGAAIAGAAGTSIAFAIQDENGAARLTPSILLFGTLIATAFILIVFLFSKIYSSKTFKRLTGNLYPYEGVWLEKYDAILYPNSVDRQSETYKSISVLYRNEKTGVVSITGRAFIDSDPEFYCAHNGEVFSEEEASNRIDYIYQIDYSDRGGRGHGWGHFVFEMKADGSSPNTGFGHFLEVESEVKVWIPRVRFLATRLERADVKKLIKKKYPTTIDDYRALTSLIQ